MTIHYKTPFAKTLTVCAVREDGKVAVTNYQLEYDHGYSAYRIYTANDIFGVMGTLLGTILNLFFKLATSIKK